MDGTQAFVNCAEDVAPLVPGEPAELVFDLLADSHVFQQGSRIRVTITGADAANFATPLLDPPPVVRLHRDSVHASSIDLPIIGTHPAFDPRDR